MHLRGASPTKCSVLFRVAWCRRAHVTEHLQRIVTLEADRLVSVGALEHWFEHHLHQRSPLRFLHRIAGIDRALYTGTAPEKGLPEKWRVDFRVRCVAAHTSPST